MSKNEEVILNRPEMSLVRVNTRRSRKETGGWDGLWPGLYFRNELGRWYVLNTVGAILYKVHYKKSREYLDKLLEDLTK